MPVIWVEVGGCGGKHDFPAERGGARPPAGDDGADQPKVPQHPDVAGGRRGAGGAGPDGAGVQGVYPDGGRGRFRPAIRVGCAWWRAGRIGCCRAPRLIRRMAPRATYIMAVGGLRVFRGADGRPSQPLGRRWGWGNSWGEGVVNVSGCPAHPDWMVGTPRPTCCCMGSRRWMSTDALTLFYGETVHARCTRRSFFDQRVFAKKLGDPECMFELGCKGADHLRGLSPAAVELLSELAGEGQHPLHRLHGADHSPTGWSLFSKPPFELEDRDGAPGAGRPKGGRGR